MSTHAYPKRALLADAARTGSGLLLVTAPFILAEMAPWQTALLGALAGVFALNGIATLRRALSPIDLGDDAIHVRGPWPGRLGWAEIRRLRLAHYSTRRDGSHGWMQLTHSGCGRRVVVDSRIVGFDVLARRAASAALSRAVRLDAASVANLRALGIDVEPRMQYGSSAR